jgi:hypothetical protein
MAGAGDLATPNTVQFLYNLMDNNRELTLIGLTAFLTGFLIFFYLSRIKEVKLFEVEKLETWEKFTWIAVFGMINFWFSSLIWGISTSISVLILIVLNLNSYLPTFVENMFLFLLVSHLIVPFILYFLHFVKDIQYTRKQIVTHFLAFITMILALVLGNFYMLLRPTNCKIILTIVVLVVLIAIILGVKDKIIEKFDKD